MKPRSLTAPTTFKARLEQRQTDLGCHPLALHDTTRPHQGHHIHVQPACAVFQAGLPPSRNRRSFSRLVIEEFVDET